MNGRAGAAAAASLIASVLAGPARAQVPAESGGVSVGEWWLKPSIQLRTRGEYRRPGLETDPPASVLGSAYAYGALVQNQWLVHERARIGLALERGAVGGVITVQDSRLWGSTGPLFTEANADQPTSFYAAYLEAKTSEARPAFLRLGRQEISWGEGRLIGVSDWSPRPRTLDAIRGRYSTRVFDFEALAAVLSRPGAAPAAYSATGGSDTGTGAQLYGVDAQGHVDPLLHVEVAGLARIARWPLAVGLVPSDTYVASARLFGDRQGLSYSVEGAYELGRTAVVGAVRQIRAAAANAHVDWQTAWPLRPKFGIAGDYASGSEDAGGTLHRFDPILPDNRSGLGQMGLYAWTNVVDGAATVQVAPADELLATVGYRHVRLADARGPWFSSDLVAIGQDASNGDHVLGNEVDAALTWTPLDVLAIHAGYGALFAGSGARRILRVSGRGDAKVLHAAFMQATLTAP